MSVRKFTNCEVNMTGEFLLFKKIAAIESYPMRGLKISKELKRLCEDVCKFMKKTTMSNIISNKFTILESVSEMKRNSY